MWLWLQIIHSLTIVWLVLLFLGMLSNVNTLMNLETVCMIFLSLLNLCHAKVKAKHVNLRFIIDLEWDSTFIIEMILNLLLFILCWVQIYWNRIQVSLNELLTLICLDVMLCNISFHLGRTLLGFNQWSSLQLLLLFWALMDLESLGWYSFIL